MADNRKIVMLCTVGTSIGGHLEGDDWGERIRINSDKLKDFSKSIFEDTDIPELVKNIMDTPGLSLKKDGQDVLFKAKSYGIDRNSFVKENLISAEVQSILGYINRQKHPISMDLHMYPSKEGISFLTALYGIWYLKEIYDANLFPNWTAFVWNVVPLDINVDGAQAFHKSVNRMFANFDEQRAGLSPNDSMVINMTGGYKSISAYASLYSLIYDIPAIYAFGDSPLATRETFDLMPLPISCAIGAMDEEISILKGLRDLKDPSRIAEILKDKTLPRWVTGLFVDGEPSSLVDSLIEQYEKGRNQTTGSGKELLRRLKIADQNLGLYLEKLIETSWSELWIGDQIPETVEHSRRHSKRIMEIAGNFLRALDHDYRQSDDKNKEKPSSRIFMDDPICLALLISSIYLHDIGHTALIYPVDPDKGKEEGAFPLSMFPSAVRETHHILSAEIIRYRTEPDDDSDKTPREPLFPDPKEVLQGPTEADLDELRAKINILKELLPEICIGHRRYARLNEKVDIKRKKAVWQVGKFLMGKEKFIETLVPMDKKLKKNYEHLFRAADGKITSQMALTVTALLRVIDGCDVQTDRIVSDEYLTQRLHRTAYEAMTLEAQLPMFEDILRSYVTKINGEPISIYKCLEEVCSESRKLTPDGAKNGTMDSIYVDKIKNISSALYPYIFKILRRTKGEENFNSLFKPENIALVQALSLANKIIFKWEQFLHFYKHRSIEVVLPVPGDGISADVDICLLSKDNKNQKAELTSVARDIANEIQRARGIEKNELGVHWEGQSRDYLGNIKIKTIPDILE
nr:hypothetical protein [uncultured Dethiosulfovibrio sp.]